MNELIKVEINENNEQIVSARELHEFLEVTERFSSWFERQLQYGFEENIDFTGCKFFNAQANQELQDYILKLDMAKEISMLSKTEKGKQARKYFIDCEKKLKQSVKIPQTYAQALLEAGRLALENEKLQLTLKEKEIVIEEQAPKVEFADRILKTKDNVLLRTFCKAVHNEGLKIGQNRLFEYLRKNKILYRENGDNFPYQRFIDSGYFVVEEKPSNNVFYNELTFTTKITPKGQIWLYSKLKKEFEGKI